MRVARECAIEGIARIDEPAEPEQTLPARMKGPCVVGHTRDPRVRNDERLRMVPHSQQRVHGDRERLGVGWLAH
jgi:hypothetical protein